MKRLFFLVLLVISSVAGAEELDPLSCRASSGNPPAIEVTHEERRYFVTSPQCRDAFLAEPERYAQLFDALAELEAEGKAVPVEQPASLVPS